MNLITGATGLVGSYLVRLLVSQGEEVRALRRKTSDISVLEDVAAHVEWIEGDVLDVPSLEQAMQGVKFVYHCSATISFVPSEVEQMMKVNVEGSANVMNAALNAKIEKLVHVSSIAAFGLAPQGKVIDENYSDPNINKCFWYYRSKQYGEREAWRASEEGLNVVVVCPSTIIGAGNWGKEPNSLFKEISKGLKFYTSATMGFVDVRDVVQCMRSLMHSNIRNQKFILTSENLSFREVMFLMADGLKVKRPTLEATGLLREFAWRTEAVKSFFTGVRPVITKESSALAGISFQFSNHKIETTLGYRFRPVKNTITETAEAFLNNQKALSF